MKSYIRNKSTATLLSYLIVSVIALFMLVAFTSCQSTTYSVNGAGLDWEAGPVQVLGTDRVTPIFNVELPKEIGGGTIPVPIIIPEDTK